MTESRVRHAQSKSNPSECYWCFCHWPCDAARALVALDAAESQVAALARIIVEAATEADDLRINLGDHGALDHDVEQASGLVHLLQVPTDLSAATQRDAELRRAAVEAERERLRPLLARLVRRAYLDALLAPETPKETK